ncbi:helix-turn-helix transcriptional regulator [Kibdelosporangium persicum]|uniref:Transcriptional regulator n=1 Tax=Kibdelosporangium persicum TaxID=2698649 RepID=A0ABX2FEW3_9PSEU|nr:helix-turn-helix transcriptional regulator [Kibdelosporangium persicum]NRN69753.1 Transcriptional regulator [Kibdelosporangium persicum]
MATSSTVQAWELGIRLKERRDELGMTVAAAGKATGLGGANLSAIETGKRKMPAFRMPDVAKVYGLTEDEMSTLEELRVGADRREWYHDYAQIYSNDFVRFLGFEAGAASVRTYQGEVIPGLLQTADYARAMIRGGGPYIRPVDVDARVESRMRRQERLTGEDPLKLWAVVGEAALLQQVGGREVMRGQLEHLLGLPRESVELRVMPFSVGSHPLIGNSAVVFTFAAPRLPDVLWHESVTAQTIVENRGKVLEVAASFEDASERALDQADSQARIRQALKELA